MQSRDQMRGSWLRLEHTLICCTLRLPGLGKEGSNNCQNDQDDGNDQEICSNCQEEPQKCQEGIAQTKRVCNTCRAPKANDQQHNKSGTTTWKAYSADMHTVVCSWRTCAGSLMHSILKSAWEALYAWALRNIVFAAKTTNLSCTVVKGIVKLLILCIGCCSACAPQT